MSSKLFFSNLPATHTPLSDLLGRAQEFAPVPDDWYLIMTDIERSSSHFAADHYQEINLVAVSSISIVLNISKAYGVFLPFVYGGDGATLIVPPIMVEECRHRLATLQANAQKRFGMTLRVSAIPVRDVHSAGFLIRVAKILVSSHYHQAVFLGDGLRYAEALMKQETKYALAPDTEQWPIDLTGLECKWNALYPPRGLEEIVCLIVVPNNAADAPQVFGEVLYQLDDIYGSFIDRHPIRPDTLSPTTHWKTIWHASHLRHGRARFTYIFQHLIMGLGVEIQTLFHRIRRLVHKKSDMRDLTTSSDTLKIDNTLKTIFAGSTASRARLVQWLKTEEAHGKLTYGMSVTDSAVMTCYIQESQKTHIRFIDGFGGGYTRAAIALKQKLKKGIEVPEQVQEVQEEIPVLET